MSDYEYLRDRKLVTAEGFPAFVEPVLWLDEEEATHFYDDEFDNEV